jgi:PHP family Zn ribbon phosphoesterase
MSDREMKAEQLRKELMDEDNYNRPTICPECGGIMIFRGVGEYKCEDCGNLGYDDYGKARNYIEQHPGANMAEVAKETGVPQKSIRDMVKESRLEIAPSSNVFMRCEICGTTIRYGRFCAKCETAHHRDIEEKARKAKNMNLSGFSLEKPSGEDGAKRFKREA